jgi:hypothetical protein
VEAGGEGEGSAMEMRCATERGRERGLCGADLESVCECDREKWFKF